MRMTRARPVLSMIATQLIGVAEVPALVATRDENAWAIGCEILARWNGCRLLGMCNAMQLVVG